jgi:hypothetical protein
MFKHTLIQLRDVAHTLHWGRATQKHIKKNISRFLSAYTPWGARWAPRTAPSDDLSFDHLKVLLKVGGMQVVRREGVY